MLLSCIAHVLYIPTRSIPSKCRISNLMSKDPTNVVCNYILRVHNWYCGQEHTSPLVVICKHHNLVNNKEQYIYYTCQYSSYPGKLSNLILFMIVFSNFSLYRPDIFYYTNLNNLDKQCTITVKIHKYNFQLLRTC